MQKIKNRFSTFSKKELDHFFSVAKAVKKNQAFTFLQAPSNQEFGKILIIASKKYGNAPERNLLKRRMKAIFWEEALYKKKHDCIIIARSHGKLYDFAALKTILLDVFSKI